MRVCVVFPVVELVARELRLYQATVAELVEQVLPYQKLMEAE